MSPKRLAVRLFPVPALLGVIFACREAPVSPTNPDVVPTAGSASAAAPLVFRAISAGIEWHSCGVTTADKAYCWGRNSSGELGDGTSTRRLKPRTVAAGGLLFEATSPGVFHTCAMTPNGRAFCWGANDRGQLGNGSPQGSVTPVGVDGGLRFDAVSVGVVGSHACGVTVDGVAYCWGDNRAAQLGDGTTEDRRVPVPVSGAS
jgi:alpha-tubulin suppressor-like RCC1 family protein